MVVEDITVRVEKMEDELQEIRHNQLMILDRLKALEAHSRPIQPQQNYAHPQLNFHSPADRGFPHNYPQSFIPPYCSSGDGAVSHYPTPGVVSHPQTSGAMSHCHRTTPRRHAPRSFSIKINNPERTLPSSEIDSAAFSTVEEVLA